MADDFNGFFKGKKVLVTGGAGFIGSHLVEKFCKEGADVTIFDKLMWSKESVRNLMEIYEKYHPELVVGDILDFETVKATIAKGFDFIVHLAALPSHRLALERPRDYAQIDLMGTVNILEGVRLSEKAKDTVILMGSTNKVYGKQEPPWQEDKPVMPEGAYAVAKAASEEFCRQYQKYYGVKSVIFRYHHVAGTRSNRDLALAIFVERVRKGQSPQIHGKFEGEKFSSCSADYTHIDDAVKGTLLALMKYDGFDIFNIANRKLTELLHMANVVIEEMKSDVKPEFVKMLPHETLVHHSDVSKAETKLGFHAEKPIEQAIKEYIEWRQKYGDDF